MVYFVTDACLLLLCFSFLYSANRLAGKNISEMNYLCGVGRKTQPVNTKRHGHSAIGGGND